jgi:hypothetical protein
LRRERLKIMFAPGQGDIFTVEKYTITNSDCKVRVFCKKKRFAALISVKNAVVFLVTAG